MSPFLLVHVSAAIIGLLAGALAMIFRKGSGLHRLAGNIFFVSMAIMCTSAIYLALGKSQALNALNGALTLYLVGTGWSVSKRPNGRMGLFDHAAMVFAFGVGAGLMTYGVQAANNPRGMLGGYPAAMYFVFGGIALACAASDVRMLMRGGVFGAKRIARHLWRMCFVLLIATGSLFPGQARLFPEAWRTSGLRFVPIMLLIAATLYWVVRVSFTKTYRNKAAGVRLAAPEVAEAA